MFTFWWLTLITTSYSQILNVELSRISQDTNAVAGNFNTGVHLVKNKYKTTTFNSVLHLQRKQNKHLILALSNISLIASEGGDLENSGFQHLRYNYSYNKVFVWEVFSQIQYNKITGIDQRFLLGSGPRFEILQKPVNNLGIATAYMYEFEEYANGSNYTRDHRTSTYIAWHNNSLNTVKIVSTFYYQPLLTNFSDYRLNWAGKFNFKLTNKLSFYTYWGLTYDTNPPTEIEKTIYSIKNGIELNF